MTRFFILLSCLISTALLQADSLSTSCCKIKKKRHRHEIQFAKDVYLTGCGCGGGGNGSDNIPPPEKK